MSYKVDELQNDVLQNDVLQNDVLQNGESELDAYQEDELQVCILENNMRYIRGWTTSRYVTRWWAIWGWPKVMELHLVQEDYVAWLWARQLNAHVLEEDELHEDRFMSYNHRD